MRAEERSYWMSVLGQAPPSELVAAWDALPERPAYRYLRRPETGLVMVRARTGGTGTQFHHRLGWGLPDAIATITANPAQQIGFDDGGEVSAGRRADLVQVRVVGELPVVRRVWRQGCRVA